MNSRASVSSPPAQVPHIPITTGRRGSGSSQGSEDSCHGRSSGRSSGRTCDRSNALGREGSHSTRVSPAGARHRSPRDGAAEEPDNTPRSSHVGAAKPMRSSASTSALPPTHHNRPRTHSRYQSTPDMEITTMTTTTPPGAYGGARWRCLNSRCGKWNEDADDCCLHCAFRRGATGERGALSRSPTMELEEGGELSSNKWRCRNSRCQKVNSEEDDFCMHCATKKGATGARGATAVIFAGER